MAARYLVPGGDGLYNSTSNWSATSGGASGASFPVAADDIIINNLSFNAPLDINVLSACKSFNASNYTGTVTMTNNLSVNGTTNTGNITLSAGMTVIGDGTFIKVPSGTTGIITCNAVVLQCNFQFSPTAASTTTISGAMQINKNLTFSLNSVVTNTINGSTISVAGDLIHNSQVSGTATIQMFSVITATITQIANRPLLTNLIINKTGILNLNDLYWGQGGRTFTYTAGIVNHTGTFYINSSIINSNGINWNNIQHFSTAAPIITLNSLFTCNNWVGNGRNLTLTGIAGINVNNMTHNAIITGLTITFTNNIRYYFNNSLTINAPIQDNLNRPLLRGNTGGAKIILGENAICKLTFVGVSYINASEGKPLLTVGYESFSNKIVNSNNCKNVHLLQYKMKQYNKLNYGN